MNDFSLNFSRVTSNYSWMKFGMPYDYATLKTELDQEEKWVVDNPQWYPDRLRYKCFRPNSPKLESIRQYFGSDAVRRVLCDTAIVHFPSLLGGRWCMNADQLFEATTSHAEFNRDAPGFKQHIHVDFKFLICTGFIYLTEHDDELMSSYFYDDRYGANPQRATTNFGDGWFAFNDHDSWHGGGNRSDQVRYTMLVGLTLVKNPLLHTYA